MKKTIITYLSLGLAFLILVSIFLSPIYKIDQEFILENFKEEVVKITEEELDSFFEHTFSQSSLDSPVTDSKGDKYVTLSEFSFEISYHNADHAYEKVEDGLKITNGITFTQHDFPDFVNLAIFAKGEGTTVSLKVNNELVNRYNLTNEIQRYDFEVQTTERATIDIIFSSTVVVEKIKINEVEPYTYEQAKIEFVNRIITYAGLIITNSKILDMDEATFTSYFEEEVTTLKEGGVPFLSLFNMAIEDVVNNYSIFSSSAGLSFSERINHYIENRHCSFFSILTLIGASSILLGSISVAIIFIVGVINKKQYNMLIPTLIILAGFMILINMSTFTGLNFFTFNGEHNFVTEYRLLFYESAKLNFSFILSLIFSVILVVLNLVNEIIDFVKEKKNIALMISSSSILAIELVMIVVGLIIR